MFPWLDLPWVCVDDADDCLVEVEMLLPETSPFQPKTIVRHNYKY